MHFHLVQGRHTTVRLMQLWGPNIHINKWTTLQLWGPNIHLNKWTTEQRRPTHLSWHLKMDVKGKVNIHVDVEGQRKPPHYSPKLSWAEVHLSKGVLKSELFYQKALHKSSLLWIITMCHVYIKDIHMIYVGWCSSTWSRIVLREISTYILTDSWTQ